MNRIMSFPLKKYPFKSFFDNLWILKNLYDDISIDDVMDPLNLGGDLGKDSQSSDIWIVGWWGMGVIFYPLACPDFNCVAIVDNTWIWFAFADNLIGLMLSDFRAENWDRLERPSKGFWVTDNAHKRYFTEGRNWRFYAGPDFNSQFSILSQFY